MNEPTTEPTADPRGSIECDPDPAEIVDTTSPPWPSLPSFPPLSSIPQDSAVEAEKMARDLLGAVVAYRDAVRPVLADAILTTVDPVEDTAELRRRVAMVADVLIRRAQSPGCVLAAQHAARLAERVAGLTLRATIFASATQPRDVFGSAVGVVREMAAPPDDDWDAAVDLAVTSGNLSFGSLSSLFARSDLSAAEREQRAVMSRLAGQGRTAEEIAPILDTTPARVRELAARYDLPLPADPAPTEVVDTVGEIERCITSTTVASLAARNVDPAEVGRLGQAQCADWSRELWETAKYILQLRARLDSRVRGR